MRRANLTLVKPPAYLDHRPPHSEIANIEPTSPFFEGIGAVVAMLVLCLGVLSFIAFVVFR